MKYGVIPAVIASCYAKEVGNEFINQTVFKMSNNNDASLNVNRDISAENVFKCMNCPQKSFSSYRGLMQHKRQKKCQRDVQAAPSSQPAPNAERNVVDILPMSQPVNPGIHVELNEQLVPDRNDTTAEKIERAYEKIVHWRKNLFMLPTGSCGKSYINELTRLMNSWTYNSPDSFIAMKSIHVMPSLILQKPSRTSKAKQHAAAVERRIELWKKGEIHELLAEGEAIQQRLPNIQCKKTMSDLSKKFANNMARGNVNAAIKLLTNNMSNGILPLTDETLQKLRQKHPDARTAEVVTLVQEFAPDIHPIIFEEIDEEMVKQAALKTRGGSGPSGMDADGWRRIFVSNHYGASSIDLRRAFSEMIKKLCTEKENPINNRSSLEAFLACRLIPLDKNPGLRPIGVGEVLRRIAGKVIMKIVKDDVKKAAGGLQMCSGHESGSEAAIHAMREIFDSNETEAVLLVDAENAFNSINRAALLHNIKAICPAIHTFLFNCYSVPARLFIIGGSEIISSEGTTQGDPTAMAAYALALAPLLNILMQLEDPISHVAFADDITGSGKIENLLRWWLKLIELGPKFGYFPNAAKSYLIVKEMHKDRADVVFVNTGVKITSSGKRHLGAVIGSREYKNEFMEQLVGSWNAELRVLSEIAQTQPQAAYSAYIKGFKHKFNYALRTITDIEHHLAAIEDTLRNQFIPAITGGRVCSDEERKMLALSVKLGGLGIDDVCNSAQFELEASIKVTKSLVENIKGQNTRVVDDVIERKRIKAEIKRTRDHQRKTQHAVLVSKMTEKDKRHNEIVIDASSNWLTALPLEEFNFNLNKMEFWDAIRLRYNWPIPNLPAKCACGESFNTQHAMSCKKGGYVIQRHNELRDVTSKLLSEVCNGVELEPQLIRLSGENLRLASSKKEDEVRLDISARDFWIKGQRTYLDVRVFDPNAKSYQNTKMKQLYSRNENEKKRHYNERIQTVDQGSFSPLVFSVQGGMGTEAKVFYARLAEKIANKRKVDRNIIISWLRTILNYSQIRSMLMMLRGSRSLKKINLEDETILHATAF